MCSTTVQWTIYEYHTRSARSTSAVKSTWPGASVTSIAASPHEQYVATADPTATPLSRSRSIESGTTVSTHSYYSSNFAGVRWCAHESTSCTACAPPLTWHSQQVMGASVRWFQEGVQRLRGVHL